MNKTTGQKRLIGCSFYDGSVQCYTFIIKGGPLHLGDIEEIDDTVCVKCPWHGWKMDLETGKVVHPAGHDLRSTLTFPVKVKDSGKLFVGVDGLNERYFKIDYDF